jgi:hypothetical protein
MGGGLILIILVIVVFAFGFSKGTDNEKAKH